MADTQVTEFTFGPKHQRGVCRHCGAPAHDGRATSCLPKGKCAVKDGAPAPKTAAAEPITSVTDDPTVITVEMPEPQKAAKPKAKRAAELEQSILRDLNPLMPVAMGYLCRPVAPENFYAPVTNSAGEVVRTEPTDLGRAVQFKPYEAKVLGRCAAELESSPIVGMATAAVGPVVPIMYLVAGVGVIGFHGYQMMLLRQQIVAAHMQQVQMQNMQQHNAAQQAPDPQADFIADQEVVHPNGEVLRPQFTNDKLAG